MKLLPAKQEIFEQMRGIKFIPGNNEGVLYVKFVLVRPTTMEEGRAQAVIEDAPGVLLCGDLNEIKTQLNEWFDQAAKEYIK